MIERSYGIWFPIDFMNMLAGCPFTMNWVERTSRSDGVKKHDLLYAMGKRTLDGYHRQLYLNRDEIREVVFFGRNVSIALLNEVSTALSLLVIRDKLPFALRIDNMVDGHKVENAWLGGHYWAHELLRKSPRPFHDLYKNRDRNYWQSNQDFKDGFDQVLNRAYAYRLAKENRT